jgi:hypothetical protein
VKSTLKNNHDHTPKYPLNDTDEMNITWMEENQKIYKLRGGVKK